jgi:predicted RNA-binding protein with PUA-like domain
MMAAKGAAMWLLKTEPSTYGYADLERDGKATWDGVKNPVALKNLRAMKVGERTVVYHTGNEKAAVGWAEVTRAAYPDPKAGDPRLVVVDLKPVGRLARPVPLAELKALAAFAGSPLVRQGRLSVVPLTAAQVQAIDTRGRG